MPLYLCLSICPSGEVVSLLETALLCGYPLTRAIQDQRDAKPPRSVLKASQTGASRNSFGGLFAASLAVGVSVGKQGAAKELAPAAGGLFGAGFSFAIGAGSAAKEVPAATGENPALNQYTHSSQTHRKSQRTKKVIKKVRGRQVTPKNLFLPNVLAGCETSITSGQIEEDSAMQSNHPQIQQLVTSLRVPMKKLAITPPQNMQNSVAAEAPAGQTEAPAPFPEAPALIQSLQEMVEQMTQPTVLEKWRSNTKLAQMSGPQLGACAEEPNLEAWPEFTGIAPSF